MLSMTNLEKKNRQTKPSGKSSANVTLLCVSSVVRNVFVFVFFIDLKALNYRWSFTPVN